MNLDPRAVIHNTEIGVVITASDLAKSMGEWFDQNIEKIAFRLELQKNAEGYEHILWHGKDEGEPRVFNVDPYTGFWRRFGIGFMSLFPIDSQL